MIIKFEPSGVHIKNGLLKVRLDAIPEPGDKTYSQCYNPVLGRTRPCLIHFITVPETVTTLEDYVHQVFDKDTVATLDDLLIRPDYIHTLDPLMRNRGRFLGKEITTKDVADLIASVKTSFAGLVVPIDSDGNAYFVKPGTFDIGNNTTSYDNALGSFTIVDHINAADGTGTITAGQIVVATQLSNCELATFFVVSGNNLTSRDSEAIGTVAAGTNPLSGLTIDCTTGDYFGTYYSAGTLRYTAAGGAAWRHAGDVIPTTNDAFTALGYIINLYGTGVTAVTFIPKIIGVI